MLTREDFVRSGAQGEDLRGIIDELIMNSPEAKIMVLLYETNQATVPAKIHGIITTDRQYASNELVKSLQPKGNKRQAVFVVEQKTMQEAEEMVLKMIKQNISQATS
jgi:hypothetical protein